MKQLVFIVVATLLFNQQSSFAQAFDDGTNHISLGFGFPVSQRVTRDLNNVFKGNSNNFDYKLTNLGTLVFKYERGIHQYFGLGLNLEYSSSKASYKILDGFSNEEYAANITRNILGFYARFNGHFSPTDKLDLYGGLGLGYTYSADKHTTTDPNPFANNRERTSKVLNFDYQFTIGARYMLKERIGLFFEVGRATTTLQFGLTFKI